MTREEVDTIIRPSFNRNVSYVQKYLRGKGADIGCGACPLLNPVCSVYVDQVPQPIAVEYIQDLLKRDLSLASRFRISNCFTALSGEEFDFIFSSHMLEDLPDTDEMARCLNLWATSLNVDGHIALILPDIEGGRYPKAGEPGSNPSHRVDIGPDLFMREIFPKLNNLSLVQLDHIDHSSESFDIVLRREP